MVTDSSSKQDQIWMWLERSALAAIGFLSAMMYVDVRELRIGQAVSEERVMHIEEQVTRMQLQAVPEERVMHIEEQVNRMQLQFEAHLREPWHTRAGHEIETLKRNFKMPPDLP